MLLWVKCRFIDLGLEENEIQFAKVVLRIYYIELFVENIFSGFLIRNINILSE